jgi:hydroxymethylglutaryl-CoA lyase
VGLSTAWGCSIEGPVDPDATVRLAGRFVEAGADELAICDTVGYANPTEVKALLIRVVDEYGDAADISAHFHDTRGLGLANVYAALEAGVIRFDATLAGLGGCPYAPNATGNIVMDDLVFLLEGAGLSTGVDLDSLVEVRDIIARNLPDERLYGMYALAGAPKGFRSPSRAA